MIHGVFGKLGAGKGLYVMDIIATELIEGFRDIVTNVPLRILPWVNGQGLPQIGLRAYLVEKFPEFDETDIDEMLARILVIEDMDKCADMYLNRRDGRTGKWFQLPVTSKNEKGKRESFDMDMIKKRRCKPCLVVIDEAWAFYPNNGGWSREPILNFYSRQQRKLKDECYIVTQHPTDCDEMFWKIAQDFHVCRNHGMERIGYFRQPDLFRVIVYSTNPAKGNAIQQREIYRRLDKKLCQCYDTTGGVGMTGGFAGDAGQKKAGLHVAWLIVGIVVLCIMLAAVPFLLQKMSRPFLMQTMGGKVVQPPKPASASPAPQTAPITESVIQKPSLPMAVDYVPVPEPPLFCTGFIFVSGRPVVFLSDGTTVEPPDVQLVAKTHVIVSGRKILMLPPAMAKQQQQQQPLNGYTQENNTLPQQTTSPVTYEPQGQSDNVQVTVIGQDRRQPPPRLNGIASQNAKFAQNFQNR